MDIFITGALPPKKVAQELIKYLEPDMAFVKLLQKHQANTLNYDPDQEGCTALEYYVLQQHQFQKTSEQKTVAGLAPLKYTTANQGNLYILALCHFAIDAQYSGLTPGLDINITLGESESLFESSKTLLQEYNIKCLKTEANYWILETPENFYCQANSVDLMRFLPLHEYWPNDKKELKLRQLLNELQMFWFKHPVNQKREAENKKTINGAWIYGGAKQTQIKKSSIKNFEVLDYLDQAHQSQDWGMWLQALNTLNQELQQLISEPNTQFYLSGFSRLIYLKEKSFLSSLFHSKDSWKKWWIQS